MISKNLIQRLTVATIGIPVILFLVFKGGDVFLYFVLLLAGIGLYEYLRGMNVSVGSVFFFVPFIGAIGAVYLTASGQQLLGFYCLLAVFLVIGIIMAVGKAPIKELYYRETYIIWGVFYIGLLYPFVYLIRGNADYLQTAPGGMWLFYLLASLWVCDTAAMFFGSRFGKHQLAPAVSPNKTIEGFIGGFIGAGIIAVIFKLFWLKDIGIQHFIYLSLVIATFGQLGDLVESLWKRAIAIKDSSAIIPGHGGVLDRFDSLLFATPPVYLYLKYVMHVPWL